MEQQAIDRLLADLGRSEVFREYEDAYREVTRLPLHLRAVHTASPQGDPAESAFCSFMREHNEGCRTCLHIREEARHAGQTLHHSCFAGIQVSAVPVTLHDEVIGYLQTGEVLLEEETSEHLTQTARHLIETGMNTTVDDVKRLFEGTHHLTPKQYEAVVRLLEIFGKHISGLAEKMSVDADHHEPDGIRKSKEYIRSHLGEALSLDRVADVANMSAAHFCRMFKKATGMNYSEYVNRLRIEKAKHLMNTTALSVSQIAYESGFNSVTHFNRTFRAITNTTPTAYRQSTSV